MIITFCGHADFTGGEEYEKKIISVMREKLADEVYLGGYGNFDSFAYKCALKYKKEEAPNLKLILVSPYLDENHKKAFSTAITTK